MAGRLSPDEKIQRARKRLAELEREHNEWERLLYIKKAREGLIDFTKITMPHPDHPDDFKQSLYQDEPHHHLMAEALEEVERGSCLRAILAIPPRHGKSELSSRRFPAWFVGRDPYRSIITATYGGDFAKDFGRDVRDIMLSDAYRQIFNDPRCRLRTGSKAADHLVTQAGGQLHFIGRGGSATGRGGDLLLIDDPLKDREEADSPTIREKLWTWFTQVAHSRLKTDGGRILIIQTRWHEDDLVGRLTDPQNPHYSAKEAKKWKVIHLDALCETDDDPMGRERGEPLWPTRFGVEYLESMRELDPRGFSALYQGRPTPDDGDFIKREYIQTYQPHELPKNLRFFAASDHAVSTKQTADSTVLLVGGVDEDDTLWLVDCWWRQAEANTVVEAMLLIMQKYKLLRWWAEKGHISQSLGSFLRKEMRERRIYAPIEERTPVADKQTRAQSIVGRMAMGKVKFPAKAPWFEAAKSEMLRFPYAVHDDFVDALAHLGLGLDQMPRAKREKAVETGPVPGTFGHLKWQTRQRDRRSRLQRATAGW